MEAKFKYKTEFNFDIHATSDFENELNISKASLDNLKPLIPKSIDLERNVDLIGAAFNAAVVNKFNKNGDGINSETAVEVIDYFINKPTNIEHKKQKVVGHIVNAGFPVTIGIAIRQPLKRCSKDLYFLGPLHCQLFYHYSSL